MNIVFWILVCVALFLVWVCLNCIFHLVGIIVCRVKDEVVHSIEEDAEERKDL